MSVRSSALPDWRRLARFGAVGLINTALGYAVILCALWLDWGDVAANMAGYAAGLAFGFALHARWTFAGTAAAGPRAGMRYVLTFLIAYGANLAVVLLGRSIGLYENPLVHLAAIAVYSCLFYLGSSRFVFVASTAPRRDR